MCGKFNVDEDSETNLDEDSESSVNEDAVETKIKSYIKILLCIVWYGSLIFVAFSKCGRTDNKGDDYITDDYFRYTNLEDVNTSKSKKTKGSGKIKGGGANKKSRAGSKTNKTGSKANKMGSKINKTGSKSNKIESRTSRSGTRTNESRKK